MKLVTTTKEWAEAVAALRGKIYIATYNIAAFQSHGPVFKILEVLDKKDTSILVGVPAFKSCTEYPDKCRFCLTKHKKSLARMAQLRDHYKNIKWSFVKESHAKFAVGDFTSIIGGRNLSDSNFHDISMILSGTNFLDGKNISLQESLIDEWNTIASGAYDIGTNAPLVFHSPYRGEIMADSSSIREEYKNAIIQDHPQSDVADYWMKHK